MADNHYILRLIEEARYRQFGELDLSDNQLTSLPPAIGILINLIRLRLDGNRLTNLPPEIAQLITLERLRLDGNQLTTLPPEVTKLPNLTSLDLHGNQLTDLPPEITQLTKLTRLDLWGNRLTIVPSEITKLISLTSLDLRYNKLTSLPPEIAKLTNLTYLNLSGNQLTSLPVDIAKLSKLFDLDLRGNQLPIPPETLAHPRDVKAIFAAIAGLTSGQRLNEAKMLVVGDGDVGKSSVVERLIYNTFNPKKQTTVGVEINDEMKVVQSEVKGEGEPVKLNIWDFGGQEIQHSTHQFFLNYAQSIFVGGGRTQR
jgi:internalin A